MQSNADATTAKQQHKRNWQQAGFGRLVIATGSSNGGSSSSKSSSSKSSSSGGKKQRLEWTPELHGRFVAAVDKLGLKDATPKKILRIMQVEGVTVDHVSSHLQKYR
jgi:SHAQKYF class myb-like DNA-binding protein